MRSLLQPYAIFKSNLRIGNGDNAVIISAGVGNQLIRYMKEGHSKACIACHLHDIYEFRLKEQVLNDFMDAKWELTDEKADISGVYYHREEIPLGLLRKAVDLRNKGFSLEFCFKHFLVAYNIDIPIYCLEEATHAFCDVTGEVRLFDGGDDIGADLPVEEEQQQNDQELQVQRESHFEEPPPYSASPSSGEDTDSEASTLILSASQLAEAGYGNNGDDIILTSSSDRPPEQVDDTSSSHGSAPLTSSNHSEHLRPLTDQVGNNDTNVSSSSSRFSTRLHSFRMKMAKREAS